jgi:hypothetical protein
METGSAISAALEFQAYHLASLLMLRALYGDLPEGRSLITRPPQPSMDHPVLNPWVTDPNPWMA